MSKQAKGNKSKSESLTDNSSVQCFLSHSSVTQTERYARLPPTHLQGASVVNAGFQKVHGVELKDAVQVAILLRIQGRLFLTR